MRHRVRGAGLWADTGHPRRMGRVFSAGHCLVGPLFLDSICTRWDLSVHHSVRGGGGGIGQAK